MKYLEIDTTQNFIFLHQTHSWNSKAHKQFFSFKASRNRERKLFCFPKEVSIDPTLSKYKAGISINSLKKKKLNFISLKSSFVDNNLNKRFCFVWIVVPLWCGKIFADEWQWTWIDISKLPMPNLYVNHVALIVTELLILIPRWQLLLRFVSADSFSLKIVSSTTAHRKFNTTPAAFPCHFPSSGFLSDMKEFSYQ